MGAPMPAMKPLTLDFSRAAFVVQALRLLAMKYSVPPDCLLRLISDAIQIMQDCAMDDVERCTDGAV
jgi:hypothetical protein